MRERGLTGRAIWAPLVAAALGGLVIGALARLLMRGIVVAIDGRGDISTAGTAIILVAFGVFALPAAVTATARPVIKHAGRWLTVLVTGLLSARTGVGDAKTILLAEDDQLTTISMLIFAFGAIVVAHGRLTQYLTCRLRALPEAARTPDAQLA